MRVFKGTGKVIADIYTGLYDTLTAMFSDPKAFFGGLATAIMNPIDTFSQMWGAVEAAWERDVINGDARSRASFFSYALVSVVGLKGVDKLGKAGKLGTAASKADNSLPYNAMKTDALKNTLKTNVQAVINEKTKQAAAFWNSKFSKEAINNTIQAVKNSEVITKAKNTLDPANIKAAAAKTYEDVVKTPIAKTQAAMKEKKEQLLDMPLPNFGLAPVTLGPEMNMTVREGIEAAKDTVVRIVGGKDGGGERNKDTGKLTDDLLNKSTCNVDELTTYLAIMDGYNGTNYADKFTTLGQWPNDIQIPKNSSVLKEDGSIKWSEVPKGGYVLDNNGNAIKEEYTPNLGEIIDRYGPPNGRYTSPVIEGKPYDYEQRSLPYVEDATKYHQYEVIGDFNKIEIYFNNTLDVGLKDKITTYMEAYDLSFEKLKIQKGEIASGFGSQGGGIQYELPLPVNLLEDLGLLKEVNINVKK